MYTRLTRSGSKLTAIIFASLGLLAASPAAANSSANASAATADVAAPVREAEAEGLGNSDERFTELFASWSALDSAVPQTSGSPVAEIVERSTVSVPSRNPLVGARLTSSYGMRDHPVLRRRANHKGIDLAAPTGTPIYATADGIVGRADWFSSYGLYVSIDHGADLETRYAHMSRLAVAAGERVKKGDVIGYVGSTGRSTGPHLHYEVRVDGVAVDPIPYMVESEETRRTQLQLAQAEESGAVQSNLRAEILEGRRRVGALGGQ